jgi:hypothetical protein
MIIKFYTKNVSETHAFNNPTQGTQCGGENELAENQRLGETRSLLSET